MSFQQYRPQALLDSLLTKTPTFSSEKKEEEEFIWEELRTKFLSMKESMAILLSDSRPKNITEKYRSLAESVSYLQVSQKFFQLCRIELGTEFYVRHTKPSLNFYTLGRKFLTLAYVLVQEIFPLQTHIEYSDISKQNAQFAEFTYPRKLYFFNFWLSNIDQLFLFQKGTNYTLLNYELRVDSFLVARGSLDYNDLFNRPMTDPFFSQKNEIIRILVMSYEVLITELKKEYEKSKQDFFFRTVLSLLEEYKRFNTLLGNPQKNQWLDQNIASWRRIERYRNK